MDISRAEAIIAKRFNTATRRIEYKIKWKGQPASRASWHPKNHLEGIRQFIEDFDSNPKTKSKGDSKPARISGLNSHRIQAEWSNKVEVNIPPKRGRGRPPKKRSNKSESSSFTPPKKKQIEKEKEERMQMAPFEVKRKRGRPRKRTPEVIVIESSFSPPPPLQKEQQQKQLEYEEQSKKSDHSEQSEQSQDSDDSEHSEHSDDSDDSDDQEESEEEDKEAKEEKRLQRLLKGRQVFERDPNFFVVDINMRGPEYLFLVLDHNKQKVMWRSEVVRNHPRALVHFYENHLTVRRVKKNQQSTDPNPNPNPNPNSE